MENKNNLFLPAAILGISFIIGVVFFTNAWKSNQSANQTISVTGSAKKEIVSDLGFFAEQSLFNPQHLKVHLLN